MAAAADIEGTFPPPAFKLVITAAAGNDIVEVRAVDPFNVQQPRGAKPVSCAVERRNLTVMPDVALR